MVLLKQGLSVKTRQINREILTKCSPTPGRSIIVGTPTSSRCAAGPMPLTMVNGRWLSRSIQEIPEQKKLWGSKSTASQHNLPLCRDGTTRFTI